MEERTIEVNVVSASDLKNVKTFGGQQASYVVAYITPQQKRSTKVDTKGGLNPTWNSKLTFTCAERVLEKGGTYLTLEIYSRGTLSDTLIGTVSIPIHLPVLIDGKEAKSLGATTEYSVRRPSGKAKGFLKVSVKLGEKRSFQKYAGTQPGYAYSQEYKKQSYPPASHGANKYQHYPGSYVNSAPAASYQHYPGSYVNSAPADNYQHYPGSYVNSAPAGGVYPPQNTDAISPYSTSQGAVYPPPPPSSTNTDRPQALTGYSTTGGTTGLNVKYSPETDAAASSSSPSSSSEPVTAYPAMGYPVGGGYSQYAQQYPPLSHPPQSYPPQGYPPSGYYSQKPSYYAPAQQPYYSKPHKQSSGAGLGTGLLAGALGGLLLGDILDFD